MSQSQTVFGKLPLSHKDDFMNVFYGVTSPYVFCYPCVLHHSFTVLVHFHSIFQSLAQFIIEVLSKEMKNLYICVEL